MFLISIIPFEAFAGFGKTPTPEEQVKVIKQTYIQKTAIPFGYKNKKKSPKKSSQREQR